MGGVQDKMCGNVRSDRPTGWFREGEANSLPPHSSLNKYLLSIYHEPGSIQSAGDTIVSKQTPHWLSQSWHISHGIVLVAKPDVCMLCEHTCTHTHMHAQPITPTHSEKGCKVHVGALRLPPVGGWMNGGQGCFLEDMMPH